MKKIYLILNSISLALLLSACGTGDMSEDTNTGDNVKVVVTACNTYTIIQSGDTLVKDSDNTSIITVFNSDGLKKVCVQTGSAHILREDQ